MNKYILISFGFMGWAFYELSGGEEFQPASVRMAHLIPAPEVTAPVAEAEPKAEPVQTAFVDTDPPLNSDEVTRVALNLTALEETTEEASAAPSATTEETITVTSLDATDDFGVPRNAGNVSSSADTPAIIPSLIAPSAETTQVTVAAAAPAFDVRKVTGNRVNVRGGPGTDFNVVSRLVRGDEVEILEDNGNGWVRMRPLDGGDEGWMADFLLTGG